MVISTLKRFKDTLKKYLDVITSILVIILRQLVFMIAVFFYHKYIDESEPINL